MAMDNRNSNLGTQKLSLDNFEKASEPQPDIKARPHHCIALSREQIDDLKQQWRGLYPNVKFDLPEAILKILDYGDTG
jgi:hypothetical protein